MNPRFILLNSQTPAVALEKILDLFPETDLILLPPDPEVPLPEGSHPDIILSYIDDKIVCSEYYYKANKELFSLLEESGVTVLTDNIEWREKYPERVAFNCLVTDKFILCREKSASEVLLSVKGEREVINTNQGYAACSTLFDSVGAITSDKSVNDALTEYGVESILIREGSVILEPYPYGFIGGACFRVGNTVYTFGKLSSHPDGKKIISFIKKHSCHAVPLFDGELTDLGGAIVI